MRTMLYEDVFAEGQRVFVAEDLDLPGCVAYDPDPGEAERRLDDARAAYLDATGAKSRIPIRWMAQAVWERPAQAGILPNPDLIPA